MLYSLSERCGISAVGKICEGVDSGSDAGLFSGGDPVTDISGTAAPGLQKMLPEKLQLPAGSRSCPVGSGHAGRGCSCRHPPSALMPVCPAWRNAADSPTSGNRSSHHRQTGLLRILPGSRPSTRRGFRPSECSASLPGCAEQKPGDCGKEKGIGQCKEYSGIFLPKGTEM